MFQPTNTWRRIDDQRYELKSNGRYYYIKYIQDHYSLWVCHINGEWQFLDKSYDLNYLMKEAFV